MCGSLRGKGQGTQYSIAWAWTEIVMHELCKCMVIVHFDPQGRNYQMLHRHKCTTLKTVGNWGCKYLGFGGFKACACEDLARKKFS